MNYKKYKTVSEWWKDIRNQDYSVPTQAGWVLSLEIEIYGRSFPEAYEKLIKDRKLILNDKVYIVDISYINELLEIKNKNRR